MGHFQFVNLLLPQAARALRQLPLLAPAAGLAVGIAAADAAQAPTHRVLIMSVISLLLLVSVVGRRRLGLAPALLAVGALLGVARSALEPAPQPWPAAATTASGWVAESPRPTPFGVVLQLRLRACSGKAADVSVIAYADSALAPRLQLGAYVQFRGRLRALSDSLPDGYRRFLSARAIAGTVRMRDVQVTAQPPEGLSLSEAFSVRLLQLRGALLRRFDHISDPTARALGRALLLGDRSGLTSADRAAFARSGAAHVLAISGAHLMLLLALLSGLLLHAGANRFGRQRYGFACVLILVLGGYGLVAGGSPPIVRAVGMAALALLGQALYRPLQPLNLLAAVVLLQLLAAPAVLFDVGFQLSVLAVAGILLAAPDITRLKLRVPRGLPRAAVELVLTTLAATLFTLPVLWQAFGQWPTWFLVANLVLVPLGAVATALGFAFLAVGTLPIVGPLLEAVLSYPLELSLRALGASAMFLSELPLAVLPLPKLPPLATAGLVAALLMAGLLRWAARLAQRTDADPTETRWL